MNIDAPTMKRFADEVIRTERQSFEIVRLLLEQERLNNQVVDKIIEIVGIWSTTSPDETLKRLEALQSQNKGLATSGLPSMFARARMKARVAHCRD